MGECGAENSLTYPATPPEKRIDYIFLTRRDPDLALLREDPEFEKMYPAGLGSRSGAIR
jgi:hypothetical protein